MITMIIKIVFITSCLIWGVKVATQPGMVFEKLGAWAENQLERGRKIWDTLLLCPFCMPTVYSAFGYGFAYLLGIIKSWDVLYAYPIVLCATSMVSGIIWTVFKLILSVKEYFDFLNRETD